MQPDQASLQKELQYRIDRKTKPPGSLGRLEEIALRAGLIQGATKPVIHHPHIVVFAGDHGIAATGLVNAYPQEVTAQMVLNFLQGGAAINVFCRQNGIRLVVADAGVNYNFSTLPETGSEREGTFIPAKIGYGTKNFLAEPAMHAYEVSRALDKGKEIVAGIAKSTGCNCIGFGEMGIGNTSSASLIMSAITQLPLVDCIGKGAGATEALLSSKIKTLQQVFAYHQLDRLAAEPLNLLAAVGGFEIAMMAGAYLEAADRRMIIVADGFIACAALLIASAIRPDITNYCIFAHCSQEQGHAAMLRYFHADPILQLGLRLGEGTGAALAIPLIRSAVNFLNEMASFEEAGVSG